MFEQKIQEHYDHLTPGFRKLADFITTNTLDAAFLTATELARRVKVDPATVIRFAQELGYNGYRELSKEIKDYVRAQVTANYRNAAAANTEEELLRALFQASQENQQKLLATELPKLAEALRLLVHAPRVWITGTFLMHEYVQFLAKAFNVAGKPAQAFHPGMTETAGALVQMQPGEVLLIVSVGVAGLDAGYAAHLAREKGLHTICVTDSSIILPARESELTITIPTDVHTGIPGYNVGPLLMQIFWEAMVNQRAEESAAIFEQLHAYQGEIIHLRAHTAEYDVAAPHDFLHHHLPKLPED